MMPDSITSIQYIEKGVKVMIFTLQMAKKMLAVQWLIGNGVFLVLIALIFVLPIIIRYKNAIDNRIRQYPAGWVYTASRVLQCIRIFMIKRWYVWYLMIILTGVLFFNVLPHLIPVPASAEYLFQHSN